MPSQPVRLSYGVCERERERDEMSISLCLCKRSGLLRGQLKTGETKHTMRHQTKGARNYFVWGLIFCLMIMGVAIHCEMFCALGLALLQHIK